jgi:hypothetical protein
VFGKLKFKRNQKKGPLSINPKKRLNFTKNGLLLSKNNNMVLDLKEPVKLRLLYGIAEKSYFDMTNQEREIAAAKGLERAKEAAFTRGLPIIYGENGYVIAEYADGRRFIHENGIDIKAYYGN